MPSNENPDRAARRRARKIAFALIVVLVGVWIVWGWLGRGGPSGGAAVFTTSGESAGVPYTVTVVQTAHVLKDSDLHNVIATALEKATWLMSASDPSSETSRFNATTSSDPVRISAETAAVIVSALKVSEQTAGAFDVTLGPILRAYAETGDTVAGPSDSKLDALRARTGYEKLILDATASTLAKTEPAITVDLRALLPGYTADLVARGLDRRKVESYLIEVGGQRRAKGRDPAGRPWPIEMTSAAQSGAPRTIPLEDSALGMAHAASGPVVDARTGRRTTHTLESVWVLHADALWAQAYANAVLILGPEDGFLLAKLLQLPALLVFRGPDGTPNERTTPAYEERFGALAAK